MGRGRERVSEREREIEREKGNVWSLTVRTRALSLTHTLDKRTQTINAHTRAHTKRACTHTHKHTYTHTRTHTHVISSYRLFWIPREGDDNVCSARAI
jgi:hypothetical protein